MSLPSRIIQELYIHCSATPNGYGKYTIRDIDAWHAARGFRREPEALDWQPTLPYIGYHGVIDCEGLLWQGRHEDEEGQHAAGHNWNSLGYCLMGTDQFTTAQWVTLRGIVESALIARPGIVIRGHREVSTEGKTCPGFDVQTWLVGDMMPLEWRIL